MNVGGIPYANDVNGFWIVMLITTFNLFNYNIFHV